MYDSAFISIYSKQKLRIYSYVLKKTKDPILAEDITSETFVKFLKGLQENRDILGYAVAWLYRVASNLIIDQYRSAYYSKTTAESEELQRKGAGTEGEESDAEVFVSEYTEMLAGLAKEEQGAQVIEALKKLSEEDQEVIELRLNNELPFKEIAVILESTEGAVKMKYSRVIDKLKALCGRENETT